MRIIKAILKGISERNSDFTTYYGGDLIYYYDLGRAIGRLSKYD